MKRLILCALLASCGSAPQSVTSGADYPKVPDERMTPGSMCSTNDGDFKEFRYSEKIPYCQRNVTSETKTGIYRAYGIDLSTRTQYTIDHLIPLSMGGNNAVTNLWPQNKAIYSGKIEYWLFCMLRDGSATQAYVLSTLLEIKHGNSSLQVVQPSNCNEY